MTATRLQELSKPTRTLDSVDEPGIIIIGQYKAIIRDFLGFFVFFPENVRVIFQVFRTKSRVLGQIGRSGKVLGFISSNFGPDPTAGYLLKGNNRGAIIIIIIPETCLLPKLGTPRSLNRLRSAANSRFFDFSRNLLG